MKKVIISALAVALLVGGFALVGHKIQKSQDVALDTTTTVQPTSTTDPGGGGGRLGGA